MQENEKQTSKEKMPFTILTDTEQIDVKDATEEDFLELLQQIFGD